MKYKIKDGETIHDFNTRFRQVYHQLKENKKPSGDILYEWYVRSLPRYLSMFILQKRIKYFDKLCDHA